MVFSQKASKSVLDRLIIENQKTIALYDQYLPNASSDPKIWELVKIRDEHKKEAALLKRLLQDMGERPLNISPEPLPESDKGKITYLIDNHPLLRSFVDREMLQIESCERALARREQLSEGIKHAIETIMLPKLKLHIDLIEQLINLSHKKASG